MALAGQVLPLSVRKEAALDLHSPFSTSHTKPIRLPDRHLASPFLTFLPLPLLNCGPSNGAAFFCGKIRATGRTADTLLVRLVISDLETRISFPLQNI